MRPKPGKRGKAKEVYRFFRSLGIDYLQFIPLSEFDGLGIPLPFTITPEQYGRFLCEIFDFWWPERRKVRIRYFDNIAEALAGQSPATAPCTRPATAMWSWSTTATSTLRLLCRKRMEAREYQPGFLARNRPAAAALQLRGEEDDRPSRVPGLRMAVDLPRRCPKHRHDRYRRFDDLDYFCSAYKTIFAKASRRSERRSRGFSRAGRRPCGNLALGFR